MLYSVVQCCIVLHSVVQCSTVVQLLPTLTWVLFVFTGTWVLFVFTGAYVQLISPTETSVSIKTDKLAVSLHRPYHHQLPLGLESAVTAAAAVAVATAAV